MISRRDFYKGFASVLGFFGLKSQIQAKPKKQDNFPWTYKYNGKTPIEVIREYTDEECYIFKSGDYVDVFYNGNLFCIMRFGHLNVLIQKKQTKLLQRLIDSKSEWTIDNLYFLYHSHGSFRYFVDYIASLQLNQKRMKDWPHKDQIKFRSDPLGALIYNAIYKSTGKILC